MRGSGVWCDWGMTGALDIALFTVSRHKCLSSSAEWKPRELDTGSMCEDHRFYRQLWIRYVV